MKQLKKDIILANVPKNRINLDIFEEIDSKNEFLKKNIQSNEFNLVASEKQTNGKGRRGKNCLLYTSPSPRDATLSRMPSSA